MRRRQRGERMFKTHLRLSAVSLLALLPADGAGYSKKEGPPAYAWRALQVDGEMIYTSSIWTS